MITDDLGPGEGDVCVDLRDGFADLVEALGVARAAGVVLVLVEHGQHGPVLRRAFSGPHTRARIEKARELT